MKDRPAIPQDASRFLESNHRTFMITLRKDGSPTGHPMAGFFGGSLYMNMYGASVKAKNLERDDRICCVVTNPSEAKDFQGAIYRGKARLVPVEEVFAKEVSKGLAWVRNPRSQGSQEQPDVPPEDQRQNRRYRRPHPTGAPVHLRDHPGGSRHDRGASGGTVRCLGSMPPST